MSTGRVIAVVSVSLDGIIARVGAVVPPGPPAASPPCTFVTDGIASA
jgi:hypothetical protein